MQYNIHLYFIHIYKAAVQGITIRMASIKQGCSGIPGPSKTRAGFQKPRGAELTALGFA